MSTCLRYTKYDVYIIMTCAVTPLWVNVGYHCVGVM